MYANFCLCTHALVPVVLGDVDREGDVLENNVAPSDVLCETISASPALEAGTIELILHYDILEEDILDTCDGTTLAERTDRETVATLTVVLDEKDEPEGI